VQLRRRAPAASVAAVLAVALAVAIPSIAAEPEWNLVRVGGPTSAPGVLVAVVDTGVDGTHPALSGRVLPTIDLVGGGEGDPNGHGTHVAGTVAGADAGCGSIGVAPDARILPVRVLDANGEGTSDVVADGIRKAADAGAAVINLSLGTDVVLRNVSGSGLREALDHAWAKGSIPVLAAGNDGVVGGLFGSGYDDVPAVVVTATDNQDRVASYATSIGSADWGIAAPGGDLSGEPGRDIRSAFPGRRCALNAGTSMAAPHVSGALAALRARGLSPRDAVQRVLATAKDLGAAGVDGTYGHGLLDVPAAVGGGAPAPASPPATTAAGAPTAPAGGATATTTPTRRGAPTGPATTAGTVAPGLDPAPGAAGAPVPPDGDATTTTRPAGADESAAPQATGGPRRDDRDDGGAPTGLVVAAVAALGIAGAGSGVAARRFGRRSPG